MSLERLQTRRRSVLLTVIGSLLAHGVWAASAPVSVDMSNPRPFGYVIGDTAQRRITVRVDSPYTLAEEALPQLKRVDNWLDLQAVNVDRRLSSQGNRYEVRLTYQVINAPAEVKTIALPAISLRFQGAGTVEQTVPEWPITIAPLTPTYVLARAGLAELRPDAAPVLLDIRRYKIRFLIYATALGAIVFYFAMGHFHLPFRRSSRPFAQAQRDLRLLPRKSIDAGTYQAALRRVHQAFNQTAGQVVFAEHLDRFFVEHPEFDDLRAAVAEFFQLSRQEFFGSGAPARSPDWLLDFCRQCRDRERGLA